MGKISHLLIALFALGHSALAQPVRPQEIKGVQIPTPNPSFEENYRKLSPSTSPNDKGILKGEVAGDWGDNSSWADVEVEYARESTHVHTGQSAQKVTVNRVTSGAVQFVQTVPLHKDRIHLWKLWARGRPGGSITLSIRKAGAPYTNYVTQTANLSAEWQEFRVFGVVPEETDGFLMVRVTSPQTFWLDDSSLEDLSAASSDAPPQKGNLLPGGGSFEAGVPYGWSVRYQGEQGFQPSDPRPTIDAATAATGEKSLRCDMPAGSSLRVSTPPISLNHGREPTVSFWARAKVAPTQIEVGVDKAFSTNVSVGNEWKRYTATGRLPFLLYTLLRFKVPQTSAANTIWLDGVQVEESATASPEYLSPEPVELSLKLPQPGHVLVAKESGIVNFQTSGGALQNAKLKLSVEDLDGRVQDLPSVAVTSGNFALPAMNNRFGIWKLRAQVMSPNGERLSAPFQLVWARLPEPKNIDAKKSYFGLHLPLSQNYFDIARRIGVRRTRLHDTSMVGKWNTVEPRKDEFRYFDEGIDAARRSGIEVLGMLDGAPRLVSTKPREGYWDFWNIPDQPGAKERWDNYVGKVVGHFKGRIDSWEIWNEPWGAWWLGSENPNATPELYGELSRRAFTVAKKANPIVSILGIDTYPGSTWTDSVLPHVGPQYFDGFSFHEYNDALFGGPQPIPMVRRREFIAAQSKFGSPKPLWNTEGGLFGVGSWLAPETGGMQASLQPAYIVRFDVTQMAAGVRAFYLYAMHTDPELGGVETVTSEYDRSVKPILAARAVLASLVDGLGVPVRSEPSKGVDLYTYPGGKVSVAWSYDGSSHTIAVPARAKALDVWGNPLNSSTKVTLKDEPVYFIR